MAAPSGRDSTTRAPTCSLTSAEETRRGVISARAAASSFPSSPPAYTSIQPQLYITALSLFFIANPLQVCVQAFAERRLPSDDASPPRHRI